MSTSVGEVNQSHNSSQEQGNGVVIAEHIHMTQVDQQQWPVPSDDVSAFPLDDDLVLYDARQGIGYVLNSTAARIWELCDGSRTVAAVAREIAAAYELPYQQALADVDEFVADLRRAGLLIMK